MNYNDFKRIMTSFADKPTDLQIDKGKLLTEIRGELIEVKVLTIDGALFVEENGIQENAISWIKNRIAGLPQLAERIIDYISPDKDFVTPCGKLLDELEFDPTEQEQHIENTIDKLAEILGRKIPGTSSIVYLTSDAGEGKTTLINTIAVVQAKRFKEKKTDWLLLPIPLGGRPFLRFDDVVIASIVNNLRFRYFYYDSFIELVQLGLIVPAFDGFEEMFMQSSTGEALSATGNLMNKLNSSGSVLIAARKAYFDYKSFSSQAKLFDTINESVSFARLSINRWNKEQFIEYAILKGINDPSRLYELVLSKLRTPEHPILSRPVLVKQLLEVFNDLGNITDLITKLESASNYFPTFVGAIIEREANFKWVDTSGEPYKPILSIDQHYQLLSTLAEEMWLNNSDSLKDTILDLISELFSEQNQLNIQSTRQVKERIKQHALIVRSDPNNPNYRFDHDEFREFFLGISLAYKIQDKKIIEVKNLLKKAQLPSQACEALISKLKIAATPIPEIKLLLDEIIKGEGQTSFVKENVGSILIRLINNEMTQTLNVKGYEFPNSSFLTIKIQNISFEDCHFQNTSLNESSITNCSFNKCFFDRIELENPRIFKNVQMMDCEISSVYDNVKEKGYYDKFSIFRLLKNIGISVESANFVSLESQDPPITEDEDLELSLKVLRKFIRSNSSINDSIFRLKLGSKADYFFKRILPDLLRQGILNEVEHNGQGQKRRFKLGVTFGHIERVLVKSEGNYNKFIDGFRKSHVQ